MFNPPAPFGLNPLYHRSIYFIQQQLSIALVSVTSFDYNEEVFMSKHTEQDTLKVIWLYFRNQNHGNHLVIISSITYEFNDRYILQ